MSDTHIVHDYQRLLERREPVGRAVVTQVWGSAPRPAGAGASDARSLGFVRAADGLPVGAADLEKTIETELGVSCRVVVRTCAELAQVVADNPYPDEPNPKLVHAIFLTDDPSAEAEAHVAAAQQRAAARGSRDETRLVGRTLYLHTPDGFGRSKLAEELSRPRGTAEGTARNWATVLALLAMCEGP